MPEKYWLAFQLLLATCLMQIQCISKLQTELESEKLPPFRNLSKVENTQHFFEHNGNFYHLDFNKATFEESWDKCELTDGNFPSQDNFDQLKAVADYVNSEVQLKRKPCKTYWIGSGSTHIEKVDNELPALIMNVVCQGVGVRKADFYINKVSSTEEFCSVCVF